jgi:nitrite reductase/ring-hydroxylating ferredoxin subunit
MKRDEHDACDACPLVERRSFLRDTAITVTAIFAGLGVPAGRAAALGWRLVRPLASRGDEHTYPIPAADGASIDKDNQIIVVRWQQKAYAFNLSCPHQNTALHWHPEDQQFQCPKHHSHYQPDGVFISGRATRGMDRFGLRRDGDNMVVDVDKFFRQDENTAEWTAAFLAL